MNPALAPHSIISHYVGKDNCPVNATVRRLSNGGDSWTITLADGVKETWQFVSKEWIMTDSRPPLK